MMNFIFIREKIETLSFFSEQLAKELSDLGYHTYIHGFYADAKELKKHFHGHETVFITFNCIGISGEAEYMATNNTSLWRAGNIRIVNILVDHPIYYHDQLSRLEIYGTAKEDYFVICIDRYHLKYFKKYYPEAVHSDFLPLAGSGSEYACQSGRKKYDIIFTGNFTPCGHFEKYIERNGAEYSAFYHGIIDDLLCHTEKPIEDVCISHIIKEIPDATDADIRQVMNNMIFIDLYVRFYIREKIIREIINAGFNLRLVGKGFEAIKPSNKKALSQTALMPTAYCLKETSCSKISLNVMPWFRDGCHDRILSAMLCGALSLTDSSIWLSENFKDMTDICFYDPNRTDKLISKIHYLTDNPDILESISAAGHQKALKAHTWKSRAARIANLLKPVK